MDLFATSTYQYTLPEELIAKHPVEPRDASRLLILDRAKQTMSEMRFRDLEDLLEKGDRLLFNDTRVIPARLIGNRTTGGECEIFLIKKVEGSTWEVLAKPGKKLKTGDIVHFASEFRCQIEETLLTGHKIVKFFSDIPFEEALKRYGQMPLPQYMKREASANDQERYQTVYAAKPGAVAAPTAGLHFTKDLMENLAHKGVEKTYITLHVGLGTFRPVQTEDIRDHKMHSEEVEITEQAASELNQPGKKVCVGTTTLRSLESAAREGKIQPGAFSTDIFIYPGYEFKYVNHLLTNFHLPGSTLLMLVCSFAGYEFAMEAYRKAVKDRFRFFSYGDAMLIL